MAVRGPATQNEITKVVMSFPGMMELHQQHEKEIRALEAKVAIMQNTIVILEAKLNSIIANNEVMYSSDVKAKENIAQEEASLQYYDVQTPQVNEEEVTQEDTTTEEVKTSRKRKTKESKEE